MADEFGVSVQSLASSMGHYPGAPKPKADISFGGRSYYDPVAMRAWWKSVQEKRSQKNNASL